MNEEIDGIEKNEKVLGRTDLNIPFCGCLSIQYYRPYFDIDTIEVFDRMLNSVSYCRRDQTFLSLIGDRPDAYGPFWVSNSKCSFLTTVFETLCHAVITDSNFSRFYGCCWLAHQRLDLILDDGIKLVSYEVYIFANNINV